MTVRTPVTHQAAGLTVTEWPGSGPTVFGLPGLGSSASSWEHLAQDLPDARVVSVDLRGRGAGQGLPGPTGLLGHAQDVATILEELDLRDVVLVGHSMGAYLALVVAREAPSRVVKCVCVDGGVRPNLPFFMTPGITRLSFSRRLRMLDREWPTIEALCAKAKFDKMVRSQPELRERIQHMLAAEMSRSATGSLRPRVDIPRAVADAADTFFGPDLLDALTTLKVPTELLLAEHSRFDGEKPFISDKAVRPWLAANPLLTMRRLKGNHVTVVFAPEVRQAVLS